MTLILRSSKDLDVAIMLLGHLVMLLNAGK
jgi:hypothetical protein